MAGVYRESTRVYRDRADSTSSDEGGYKKRTTVRRYKVAPSRVETLERIERERVELDDDDRRSRYSNYPPPLRTSGEFPYAERPRSAFDSRSQVVERQVIEREREVDPYRTDSRSVIYEKDYERERRFDDNRSVIEVELVVDKRVERREDGDVQVEKRIEEYRDDHGGAEVEKYRKETEYYSPVSPPPIPQPVIIRQKAPEPQQIIVQEAPPPAPIVLPRQEPNIVVLREREQPMVRRDPREDEYYYRLLAGAALGGLGTEIIRRARSAYEENYGDDYYDRHHGSRSRSRSRSSRIKTGLGIAAAALAVAGAANKIYKNRKDKKEREIERELSDEEYEEDLRRERRRSRRRSRSRLS
uniref:DUF3824 domain-containing protein n=1 Tax=Colletotrichum fructicola (strain Nara gc5) TaxID=1213859 RepID=L2FSP2_COLFN